MTLDEAIKHAEDVASANEQKIESIDNYIGSYYTGEKDKCIKCAEEHRQLAAWLRDYKRLLAIDAGVDVKCGNCRWDGVKGERCFTCYQYSNWEEVNC